jgi:hypothetical protein
VFYRCKNLLTNGPGSQINLILGAGPIFYSFPVCPRQILVVCGLLPGENNLSSGCHRDSKPAIFSPQACSPTGEADKNLQTGLLVICGLQQA